MTLPTWHVIKSRASFLKRKDLDGMRVSLLWPETDLPDPNEPIPRRLGRLVRSNKACGWVVLMDGTGSVVDLPAKDFYAHCVMADRSGGQGRRQGA